MYLSPQNCKGHLTGRNGENQACALTSFSQAKNGNDERDGERFWLRKLSENFGTFGTLGNNFGKMTFAVKEQFFEGDADEYLQIYKKLF